MANKKDAVLHSALPPVCIFYIFLNLECEMLTLYIMNHEPGWIGCII